jgi:hypothetical protein
MSQPMCVCVCHCIFIIQLMIRIYGVTQWVTVGLLPSSMCHCLSHHACSNAVAYVIVEQYVVKQKSVVLHL